MRYLRQSSLMIVTVVTAAVGLAATAVAPADPGGSPVERLKASPGPEAFLAADHIDVSQAQPVFVLNNGQTVSVAANDSDRCLLHGVSARTAGRCFTEAQINEGAAVTVIDECGTAGRNLMEITGLAPTGARGARLTRSDGSSEVSTVEDGVFEFEGTNPGKHDPYPTSVSWLGKSRATVSSADIPVGDGEFCLPAS
jgi:hypothetical protein